MPETDETLKIVMNFHRVMMSNKDHPPQQLHRLRTMSQDELYDRRAQLYYMARRINIYCRFIAPYKYIR